MIRQVKKLSLCSKAQILFYIKKIAFPPLAGSAIGVIGDSLKMRFSQWYRKVFYTFLYHKQRSYFTLKKWRSNYINSTLQRFFINELLICAWRLNYINSALQRFFINEKSLELEGIEPSAPSLRTRCSPAELQPLNIYFAS